MSRLLIMNADARHIPLSDKSVHCVVTSPPYWGLRDYGIAGQLGLERTPEKYVTSMVAVFGEVKRVLRDDGTVFLNLGDSYFSSGERRTGRNDTNRETPGGRGGSFRGGARCAIGCDTSWSLKPKDLVGIPWMVAFALRADGWYLRSDIIWSKPNPMPESVTDRPTKAHEYLFLLAKSQKYYYDADSIREPHKKDSLARYEYGLKAKQAERGSGVLAANKTSGIFTSERMGDFINHSGRNRRSVWHIATQPYPGAHFATFPEKLVEPCILAGVPEGGIVLDPFSGSGTVGRVAIKHRRSAILMDLNMEYLSDQATSRTENVQVNLAV